MPVVLGPFAGLAVAIIILLVLRWSFSRYKSIFDVMIGSVLIIFGVPFLFANYYSPEGALVGILYACVFLIPGILIVRKGLTSMSSKGEMRTSRVYQFTRICPRCGRNLSNFPDDIKRCPYCGNELI